jgi:hypothetical protein
MEMSQDGRALRERIVVDESLDSGSSTEELDVDNEEWELLVREETQNWLATHGAKLFALEASKFFATQEKKKNLRGFR